MKSIGIKLADGSFYPVMQEGSAEKKTLDVTTVQDNQTTVQIDLYSSETNSMDDAEYIDSLEIKDLNPHPNGVPSLRLDVNLDEDNRLQTEVRDPETGRRSSSQASLVSRSPAERSQPANFSIGEAPGDAVPSVDDSLTAPEDADFSFDALEPAGLPEADSGAQAPAPDAPAMPEFNLPDDVLLNPERIFDEDGAPAQDAPVADGPVAEDGGDFGLDVPDVDSLLAPDAAAQDFDLADASELEPEPPRFEENKIIQNGAAEDRVMPPLELPDIEIDDSGFTLPGEEAAPAAEEASPPLTADDLPSFTLPVPDMDSDVAAETGADSPADDSFDLQDFLNGGALSGLDAADDAEEESDIADLPIEIVPDPEDAEEVPEAAVPEDDVALAEAVELDDAPVPTETIGSDGAILEEPPEDFDISSLDFPAGDALVDTDTTHIATADDGVAETVEAAPAVDAAPPASEEPAADGAAEAGADMGGVAPEYGAPAGLDALDALDAPPADESGAPSAEPEAGAGFPAEGLDGLDLPDFDEPAGLSAGADAGALDDLPDFGAFSDSAADSGGDAFDDLPDFSDVDAVTDSSAPSSGGTDFSDFDVPFEALTGNTSADTDFSVPDFGDSPTIRDKDFSTVLDDFNGDTFDSAPMSNSSNPLFANLYDDETMGGEERRRKKDHTKGPVVVCVICAVICLLAAAAIFFLLPARFAIRDFMLGGMDFAGGGVFTPGGDNVSALPPVRGTVTASGGSAASPEPIQAQEDTIVIATTPRAVVPDRPARSASRPADIRYRVVWGDTLWDIANAYYKNPWRYTRIAEYNHIRNPDYIMAGQVLLIPAE